MWKLKVKFLSLPYSFKMQSPVKVLWPETTVLWERQFPSQHAATSARFIGTQVIYCYVHVPGVCSPVWQLTDHPYGQALEGSLSVCQLALISFQDAWFSPALHREPGHFTVLDSYCQGTQNLKNAKPTSLLDQVQRNKEPHECFCASCKAPKHLQKTDLKH